MTCPCGHAASAAAENFAHHPHQLQDAGISDAIINPVGIFARQQHFLVAQNGQMLRNIALRRADSLHDFLHTGFLIPNDTKNLETERMRYRLENTGRLIDMLLFVDKADLCNHVGRHPLK